MRHGLIRVISSAAQTSTVYIPSHSLCVSQISVTGCHEPLVYVIVHSHRIHGNPGLAFRFCTFQRCRYRLQAVFVQWETDIIITNIQPNANLFECRVHVLVNVMYVYGLLCSEFCIIIHHSSLSFQKEAVELIPRCWWQFPLHVYLCLSVA